MKRLIPLVLVAALLCGGCTASVAGEAMPDPAVTTTAPVTAGDTVPPSSAAPTTAPSDSPYVYGGESETAGGTGLIPNDGPNSFGGVR